MENNLVPFSELLSDVIDNRGRTCPTADTGIPLIATNCVRNDILYPVYEKIRYVSRNTYETWFRGHPKPGDLIFVLKGTPGRVCITPDPVDFCIAQDMVGLRVDESRVDPKYLFALLRSDQIQAKIEQMHVGTLIPHFKKGDFDKLLLPILTNRQAQKFIGNFYFTLSSKIDANRRLTETLDEIAKTLFKSLFVDFRPVKARTEASDRIFPQRLVDLYPDSFGDSEVGKIPTGWRVASLDEIGHFLNGLALQKFPPAGNHFLPVIKIAQLRTEDTNGADKASADLAPEYIVNDGDVLFSWSGSLECVLWAGGRGALNQHLFKVTSESYPKWFYFLWIFHHLDDFRQIAAGKATTMGHIQRGHLSAAKVLIPRPELLEEMSRFFTPLIDQIVNLKVASKTLASVRDASLPKLISGELRVPDAQRILGAQP